MVELDPRLASRFRSLSRAAALASALIGAVALLGWTIGVDLLKSAIPGMVTMKPNTGICFLATGLALRALVEDPSSSRARLAARAAAGAVALLSLAVLSQYLFDWNLGIDELLFDDPEDAAGTSHPGRMAPNTAVAFILTSAALLLLDRRVRGVYPAPLLAVPVAAMSLTALLGYTSAVTTLYGLSSLTQMAIPTAAGFVLFALAIPFARPERGAMRLLASPTAAGHIARRLLPAVVLIPAGLGLVRLEGQELGLFSTRTGTWLFVIAIVSLAVPLAYLLAQSLEREEQKSRRATAALEDRERQYRAKYRAARVLSESRTLDSALEGVLAAMCEELGWPLAAVWLEDREDGCLKLGRAWGDLAGEFGRASTDLRREPPVSLPVRVWGRREPAYVADTAADPRFVRKRLAADLGLRSALCAPIIGATGCHGSLELLSPDRNPANPPLDALSTLGFELGQFLERIRAEEELRLQGTIVSNMAEGVCLVRVSDLAIVYANETFERMFGYEPGELLNKPVDAVNAPSGRDPAGVSAEIQVALARDGVWSGEVHNLKKDGTPFWCRANVANFDHPQHGTVSVAVHTDITARKRAEEDLRENRERLAAILDNSPTVIFLKDVEGRYLLVNRQFEERWHVERALVVGHTDHELWPGEIADMVRANDLQVIEEGSPLEVEEVILDRTYLSVKFPLQNPGGEIYAVGGIATDITDRKQADDALRREGLRLAEAQAVAKLGSWEWDLTTDVSLWSDEQCRIMGSSPARPFRPPRR